VPDVDQASQSELSLRGRIGAYGKWQKCDDPTAATKPARRAFLDRFYDEVDPERELPDGERERRAEYARKAYFTKLALASARARRAKKSLDASDGRRHQAPAAKTTSDAADAVPL
jgi:hypothetical protein